MEEGAAVKGLPPHLAEEIKKKDPDALPEMAQSVKYEIRKDRACLVCLLCPESAYAIKNEKVLSAWLDYKRRHKDSGGHVAKEKIKRGGSDLFSINFVKKIPKTKEGEVASRLSQQSSSSSVVSRPPPPVRKCEGILLII
uniref:Uncharacterized protein n=1 Tax=Chromera velia CCMP2878 TaxID=1169474 RepID=A0A0G4GUQ0_9ALVE|eukprot:Cvel_5232.t1-p1 / transcript=Cvel_5232.t1 / gene=Cvel_5232 / organism=Chromera_velia_CCMP2878 / gene_product=hypothetical protein / transcript_product=hypothetical protein / location=Cvel_scaffold241:9625-10041(-) / protein_length=139 / sequence_SO=supercontig / SO=protein_coding / is_pseudo=false